MVGYMNNGDRAMTTRFNAKGFYNDGPFLMYRTDLTTYAGARVVARFKWNRGRKAPFKKELIKNHTVEEYFAKMASGLAPLQIVDIPLTVRA
jgi:hypothetical protein